MKQDSPIPSPFRSVPEMITGSLSPSTEVSGFGDLLVVGLFPGVVNKLIALDTDLSIVLDRSEIDINTLQKYLSFSSNHVYI